MERRLIPVSGEALPVIGLGTYVAFDFGPACTAKRDDAFATLRACHAAGARLFDSSPMYGQAEERLGEALRQLGGEARPFVATKVWTHGQAGGVVQMERSLRLLGRIDLMQIHNLVDAGTHLRTLREWREAGRLRYIGVSHYQAGAYAEVESFLQRHRLDFLQINYSPVEAEAGNRLLPFCRDHGIAVIANRPFAQGELLARLERRRLPEWAAEAGCASWPQLVLKWILGHPAVTCVIPATRNPRHAADNLAAGEGALPDEGRRRALRELAAA